MTNMSEKEQLMSLFFEGDIQHIDLKLFRGDPGEGGIVTDQDICREMRSAFEQKRAGTADVSKNFNDDAAKVDVRTLFRP